MWGYKSLNVVVKMHKFGVLNWFKTAKLRLDWIFVLQFDFTSDIITVLRYFHVVGNTEII